MHDGHHVPEPDRDPHGDRLPGRDERPGVGGLQRVLRHAVPDRRGPELPHGHHRRGQRGGYSPCVLRHNLGEHNPCADQRIQSTSVPSVIYSLHERLD